MVGYHPVVEDVEEEGGGEDDDGHQVEESRILQNHLQSVSDGRILLFIDCHDHGHQQQHHRHHLRSEA